MGMVQDTACAEFDNYSRHHETNTPRTANDPIGDDDDDDEDDEDDDNDKRTGILFEFEFERTAQ
eukprot:2566556-Ditylum_brightwellii.AAC.1